jgi:hypothetical protein
MAGGYQQLATRSSDPFKQAEETTHFATLLSSTQGQPYTSQTTKTDFKTSSHPAQQTVYGQAIRKCGFRDTVLSCSPLEDRMAPLNFNSTTWHGARTSCATWCRSGYYDNKGSGGIQKQIQPRYDDQTIQSSHDSKKHMGNGY